MKYKKRKELDKTTHSQKKMCSVISDLFNVVTVAVYMYRTSLVHYLIYSVEGFTVADVILVVGQTQQNLQ